MERTIRTGAILVLLASLARAQVTERVNVDSGEVQANGESAIPSISADGRYVAFESSATNLVAGDTNDADDVFVRDRWTGATERVSVDSAGLQGGSHSHLPAISADGRFVAFLSGATNLVPGDSNGVDDVFVRDRLLGTTERVSVDSAGMQADSSSTIPLISADGRYVAFHSAAGNLVAGDTNGLDDVFLRDRQLGTTARVSLGPGGAQGDGPSASRAISSEGRFVVFTSVATNLVAGDANGVADAFVRDRQSATTSRVSVATGGTEANGVSDAYSISADGRFVAFHSVATDLVPGDTNGTTDVFLRDRGLGTTERVSLTSTGGQASGGGAGGSISADGRCVGFTSFSQDLVPGDTNGWTDVFVRDLELGTTERVSLSATGEQGNHFSSAPRPSEDGRFVAFVSWASNFVADDTNSQPDVFVRDRDTSGFTSLCSPGLSGVIACPCANPPSGPGRGCDNSAATGGAILTASGRAYLASDTLVFTTSGGTPGTRCILTQWRGASATGIVFGMGVRCASGNFERLYQKAAVGGSITAPGPGDPPVSARSAARGDVIQAGQSRWYLVHYRDPTVLGSCPLASRFNSTQTGRVVWSP